MTCYNFLADKSSWPSLKTLLLLRLWSLVFPCSDFRHAVMTPAALLMCEYLMRCSIVSGQDIVVGSFLCSMMLNVSEFSALSLLSLIGYLADNASSLISSNFPF